MVRVLKIAGRPEKFSGEIRLPPSKSYLHRALFTSALTQSMSSMIGCGTNPNNDVRATINCIKKLGSQIEISPRNHGTIVVAPSALTKKGTISVNAQASGTTARFLIPFSALTPDGLRVRIEGDASLRRRPMEAIFDSLTQLGVRSKALNSDGRLPIVVEGGGIEGGDCEVDGSISSQFISSLLIACTRARKDSTLHIKNPETVVSKPYILATLAVLSWFGFRAEALESSDHEFTAFKIAGDQKVRGKKGFPVPGDMSSGASLVCAVLAARGEISLSNAGDEHFPQSDSAVVPLARKFGGALKKKGDRLSLSAYGKVSPERFDLDLGDSPDLVPPVVGVSAATGSRVKIMNIGHLRFKESDRIETLARELQKMGAWIKEDRTSIEILPSKSSEQTERRKPILLDPEKDHRMLIAFTIAGLSGKFGEIAIKDPDCVKKSYPDFVSDLQHLCHEKKTIRIAEL